ncbi:MAG TPA: carboxypeptidase-like regulatory domain-containing protein, partial [Terriglobia bacterium]|nr:carboxypeptidase-like regulatory domain-containing protein [Terriglobia bacterium]
VSSNDGGVPFVRTNDQGEFRLYGLQPGEYYLRASGGGGAFGSSQSYYYPGVTDEARAAPIKVSSGDEIQVGTLRLPIRDKGVEVRFHLKGDPSPQSGSQRLRAFIDGTAWEIAARSNQAVLSIAPGHHDILFLTEIGGKATNFYSPVSLDVGSNPIDQDIAWQTKVRVSGSMVIEDEAGKRIPAPESIRCQIQSPYELLANPDCVGAQLVPGVHEFNLEGMTPDMYLLSARVGDRDVLANEWNITGDTTLEVVLATPGAVVDGVVRTADGTALADAVVVLVPDAPYDKGLVLYRSVISDSDGKYEIHGVSPGSYKIYAWPELEGYAYRNAEFMKEFRDRGTPLRVEKKGRAS